jgi:hypothetical protein
MRVKKRDNLSWKEAARTMIHNHKAYEEVQSLLWFWLSDQIWMMLRLLGRFVCFVAAIALYQPCGHGFLGRKDLI